MKTMAIDDEEKMAQLSETNVVLLIEYYVLAIIWYEKFIRMCTAYFYWKLS